MYPQACVDIRNPAVGLCESLSHANPSMSPIQNSTLPSQCPVVCLQPPVAYQPWYTICLSGDLQIFPSLPQLADWTSQHPGCYPVYAPQRCPVAKAPMAIWSSYRDRRLGWAYLPVGPVGVSSMDDYSLPLSLTSLLLIAPLGVDCKFAVLNLKKKIILWRVVGLHSTQCWWLIVTARSVFGWIQTELASSLAKNATKANAFEIIPLETIRKKDNWKTEEALARAAVTP